MHVCRNLGGIGAIGVGIGAAFSASMGLVGYPLGLAAAITIAVASRLITTAREG
jgi:hypothetical protein